MQYHSSRLLLVIEKLVFILQFWHGNSFGMHALHLKHIFSVDYAMYISKFHFKLDRAAAFGYYNPRNVIWKVACGWHISSYR